MTKCAGTTGPLWRRLRHRIEHGAIWVLGAVVLGLGTGGFMWIEGWGLRESFYMTVITLSTVGFGEVRPLSDAGRVFTVFLILGGVATLSFALRDVASRLITAPRRRLLRRIRRMKNHTIICGAGRIARPVIEGLARAGQPFAVIEKSPQRVAQWIEQEVSVIEGDATAEEVLVEAGLPRAKSIVALLPSDGDNLSIAMTATGVKPGIRIIARSEEERSRANLERAGADKDDVVSPYATAGRWVLHNLAGHHIGRVVEGFEEMVQQGFDTGRLYVPPGSKHDGLTLAQAAINPGRNVLVLAIRHDDGEMVFAPTGDERIQGKDTLILVGRADDLRSLGAELDDRVLAARA